MVGSHSSTAGGESLIPRQGTKIPYASQPKKKKTIFKKKILFLKTDSKGGS